MTHILDEALAAQPDGPDPRIRTTGAFTASYVAIHPDGHLEHRRGNFFEVKHFLDQEQGGAYSQGDLGNDPMGDLPGISVYWISPFERGTLPANPVANQLIQVFDGGETPGRCEGIVVFSPEQFPGEVAQVLTGHRLELLLKIHAEIRRDLDAGREPRQRLWPSEMITASRSVAPDAAWEAFQDLRGRLAPGEKVTQVIREREVHLRAGRNPDHEYE
ncbi:hypothetical protein ABZ635_22590 [Nocardiopsis sp. NPDC007018]|uniref:hypothetical protein n=1 Tax=Nocardiopsis sp. NPDC007018 TaxID=3155721 RepID=UPI0034082F6D